jgi:hypothetical protein
MKTTNYRVCRKLLDAGFAISDADLSDSDNLGYLDSFIASRITAYDVLVFDMPAPVQEGAFLLLQSSRKYGYDIIVTKCRSRLKNGSLTNHYTIAGYKSTSCLYRVLTPGRNPGRC